tara:strand:- start:208 stop:438 length:231 start_codon:yes stop_codon:yes gene_type:complete
LKPLREQGQNGKIEELLAELLAAEQAEQAEALAPRRRKQKRQIRIQKRQIRIVAHLAKELALEPAEMAILPLAVLV